MNLLSIIKLAVAQLLGLNKVIKALQTRVRDLESANEILRNSHEMDTVSLRNAAAAQAAAVAQATADASAQMLAELSEPTRELLAAINDHPDAPIYDEEFNLLAPSGVPAISDFPEGMTPEEIAQVEAEAADAPQVPTNLVAEFVDFLSKDSATINAELKASASFRAESEAVETEVLAPVEAADSSVSESSDASGSDSGSSDGGSADGGGE